MFSNLHPARYVVESARCAVVSSDAGSFLLGYFVQPRHEWIHVSTYADEASARRAFKVFDQAVAEFERAWRPKLDRFSAVPAVARSTA